jgi:hypothetical protein
LITLLSAMSALTSVMTAKSGFPGSRGLDTSREDPERPRVALDARALGSNPVPAAAVKYPVKQRRTHNIPASPDACIPADNI